MREKKIRRMFIMAAGAVLFFSVFQAAVSGCNLSAGSGASGSGTTSAVSGTVLNSVTGDPVEGVTVSDGTASATTDAEGAYSLTATVSEEPARVRLSFSKDSFAANQRIIEVNADAEVVVDTALLPAALTAQINPAVAQTLLVSDSPARVSLAENSLVDADGNVVTGTVTASVTPIDASSDPDAMPGDFVAESAGGDMVQIESFGALDVSFTDADGNPLNLGEGQEATIRIPLPAEAENPPATIPLYYYDTDQGLWIEEGEAALAGEAPVQYYEGTVTHFSTWNADQAYSTTYICGRIVDGDGAPIDPSDFSSVKIHSEGEDFVTYDESPETWTSGECAKRWGILFGCVEDGGDFIVASKSDAHAIIYAEAVKDGVPYRSNEVRVATGADASGETCVTTLSDDDDLVLDLSNASPKIKAVESDRTYVGSGSATLTCAAEDADGDTLAYSWDVEGPSSDTGTLSSETGAEVTWTAPSDLGTYTFTCFVSDAKVRISKTVSIFVTGNDPPEIASASADPATVEAGSTSTLSCNATDTEGDTIYYNWMVSGGSLSSYSSAQTTWTAPSTDGTYVASCTVAGSQFSGGSEYVTLTVTGGTDDSDTSGGSDASGDLPTGFPTDLPAGDYSFAFSYSITVAGQTTQAGPIAGATLTNEGDIDAFADSVVDALNDAASAITDLGCSTSVSYSDWNGTSFTATLTVSSCSVSGVTYSATYDYTITKN